MVNRKLASSMGKAVAMALLAAFALSGCKNGEEDSKPHPQLTTSADARSIDVLCVIPKRREILADMEVASPANPGPSGSASSVEQKTITADARARLKKVRYEICDAWIRSHFTSGRVSDQLIALRNGIDQQKDNAQSNVRRAFLNLQRHQWIVVALGLFATILSAWASRGNADQAPAKWWVPMPRSAAFIAMIFTAFITAATAIGDFYNLRGGVARNWTVESAMGSLHSQIDDELLSLAAQDPEKLTQAMIKDWNDTRDRILRQAGEEWTHVIRGKQLK